MEDYLESLIIDLGADEMIICLTDDENFRKSILPTYKANRDNVPRPYLLKHLKEVMERDYTTYKRPGLEADDCLGILLTHPKLITGEKVCVSNDKDMKSLPGKHAHLSDRTVFEVSQEDADYWHMYQTLIGDSTDNYAGCPGVGPVKAEKILSGTDKTVPAMWEAVVEAYTKAKLSEEEALIQARVARILRYTDYNFKTKEPILWKP